MVKMIIEKLKQKLFDQVKEHDLALFHGLPNSSNRIKYYNEGNDIEPAILFGEYESLYLGLMKNRLNKDGLSDSKLNEMTRCHINRGVTALAPRIQNLGDFYELIKEERNV